MCVALCVIGWISYGMQVATHQYNAQCTSHLAKLPKPTFNSVGKPDYTSHCTFYRHLEGRIGFNQSFLVYREGLSRVLPDDE